MLVLPTHGAAQSLVSGGFESVQPCSLEQHVAPSSDSELRALRDNLDADVRFAFQAGEKVLALNILCRGAAAGIADAEFRLGLILSEGWGSKFDQDETRGRYWLKRAADRGDMRGTYALSVLYRLGRGGPVMGSEGMRLLRAAAASGNSDAQFDLAYEYVAGEFVPADWVRARHWASLAANAGHQDARKFLTDLDLLMPK